MKELHKPEEQSVVNEAFVVMAVDYAPIEESDSSSISLFNRFGDILNRRNRKVDLHVCRVCPKNGVGKTQTVRGGDIRELISGVLELHDLKADAYHFYSGPPSDPTIPQYVHIPGMTLQERENYINSNGGPPDIKPENIRMEFASNPKLVQQAQQVIQALMQSREVGQHEVDFSSNGHRLKSLF